MDRRTEWTMARRVAASELTVRRSCVSGEGSYLLSEGEPGTFPALTFSVEGDNTIASIRGESSSPPVSSWDPQGSSRTRLSNEAEASLCQTCHPFVWRCPKNCAHRGRPRGGFCRSDAGEWYRFAIGLTLLDVQFFNRAQQRHASSSRAR